MISRRSLLAALLCCAVILGLATVSFGAPIRAAGQGGEGWIALRTSPPGAEVWALYHAPHGAEPGASLRVRGLNSGPEVMAARDARLMLIYPGLGDGVQRSVRGLRVESLTEGRSYRYLPAGRQEVLPSLPGWGTVAGLLLLDDGAVALLQDTPDDGPPRAAAYRFDFTAWTELALPDRIDPAHLLGLAPQNNGFGIVEHHSAEARLWTVDTDGAWASSSLVVDPDETIVAGANNALIGVKRASGGEVTLRLLRSDRAVQLASISNVPMEFGVFAVGENVQLAWMEPPEDTRLHIAVVSSSSGEVLFNGGAQMQSILSPNDLQYLALLMLAVMLMVLIFVLRPAPEVTAEIALPEGVAPAAPGRRLVAAAIDVLPIAYASSLVWGASFLEAIGLGVDVRGAGVMPLLTTIGSAFLMQTLMEWRLSWTLGKLATGCRTMGISGASRLTLRQAVVRNLVKYACPPLTTMIIADPTRRHPGDFFAGTIVIAPAEPAPPGPPDQP